MAEPVQEHLKESADQTKAAAEAPLAADAPRTAPTAAPNSPPTAPCSRPSAPMRPGCAPVLPRSPAASAHEAAGGRRPRLDDRATGTALVLFSAFCFVAGVWRQLFAGAPPPNPDVPRLPPFVLVALNLFLALVALAALLGVWFGGSGS